MKEGKLVPMEVIIGLLRAAMVRSGASDFLIDGFPRALDQAEMFERMVKPAELVLAFDCPEEVMEERLLKRGKTSGRSDDNAATIRKRFETFAGQSLPVITHYEQLGKCHRISAVPAPEEVFEAVQAAMERSKAEAKLLEAAKVVFVLGGPGSGKGTQCERVVAKYGHTHLSAGDLLRDEVKSGSELGRQCEAIMKEGKLVPMEVSGDHRAVRAAMVRSGASDFLIDGFPRALDQAEMFERMVKPAELVLAFDCPKEVMEERLLKRGKTSGRSDDNAATIRKRFETFVSQSVPVITHYEQLGKCHRISAIPAPEEVFEAVQAVIEGKAVATIAPPPNEDVQMVVPLAPGELHPDASIVFVLGGPGSGKGTQCERIVAKYGHTHLSAGDLLRDEVKSGSQVGRQCEAIMKEGKLVPMEVTIALIRNAMVRSGASDFLIDGFPRAMDQALAFEQMIKPCSQSLPVISHYEQLGKCHRISAVPPPDEVFSMVCQALEPTARASLSVTPASQQPQKAAGSESGAGGADVEPALAFA
ncbi:adenylate kinase-domain-containing protein [Scenedesmus sp. NREL 46B-D3]|nr:adenylate kinase-domain-containing protein [Scenedesmus sp. NREL 46B-D3]